jgi:hypothetical protein
MTKKAEYNKMAAKKGKNKSLIVKAEYRIKNFKIPRLIKTVAYMPPPQPSFPRAEGQVLPSSDRNCLPSSPLLPLRTLSN